MIPPPGLDVSSSGRQARPAAWGRASPTSVADRLSALLLELRTAVSLAGSGSPEQLRPARLGVRGETAEWLTRTGGAA